MPGLPVVLHQTLLAYAARQRRILVLRGLGETAMAQIIGLAGVAAIDATVHPGHGAHWALSAAAYAAAGSVLVVRVVLPLVARPRLVAHALEIESRSGGRLEERLSSAVELAGQPAGGVSTWMIERTIALAAQEAASLDVVALYSARSARLAWVRAGMLTAAMAGCCLIPGVSVFLLRAAWPAVLRPSRIHLEVLPGDLRLASGAPLEVQVRAYPDPGSASLEVTWDDGVGDSMPLDHSDGAGVYSVRLSAVTRGLRYRIRAGDGESRGYRVEVSQPPVLEKLSLKVTPPAYTGLPTRTVDGGDTECIAGSTVVLQAQMSGAPTATGSITYDGAEHAASVEGGLLRAEIKPTATLSYGVRLVGTSGLVAELPQRWLLTVIPDRPPQVKLSGRGLDSGLIGTDEAVVMEVEATDDIGLRSLELVVDVDGTERRRIPLTIPPGGRREAKIQAGLDLPGLAVQVGGLVTVVARATDVGGQTSVSRGVQLAVASSADAHGAALATRLRAVLKRLDAQSEALRAMARQWTLLARADHGDDHAEMLGELKLLANRISLWSSELAAASIQLRSEGAAGGMALAPLVLSLGEELSAWTRGEEHQLGAACSEGQLDKGASAVQRGRELSEAANADLAGFRHDLALVVARLESSTLAGVTESAFARLERAMPIALGERGWKGDGQQSAAGLLGIFYSGTEMHGEERFREIAVPIWRDRDVPKLGRDNFSVRYSGEVHIAGEGDWIFVAGADDGVRLSVEGHDLLPKYAWKTQGYTDYRGRIHLSAGWHPIVLEMFQGSGGSGLGLAFGNSEQTIRPVTLADLRSSTGGDSGAMVRAMSELSRAEIAAGDERIRQSLLTLSSVPDGIGAIGGIAANDEIERISRQHVDSAKGLATTAGALATTTLTALTAREREGGELAADARRTRDVLEEQVARELHGRVQSGDLSALRQDLARVRDRAQELYRIPERMPAQDRDLRLRIEYHAGQAWIAEIGREALAARRALLDDARRSDALMPTRAAALHGVRHLAAFEPAVRDALAMLAAKPDNNHQAGDRLNEQAGRLEGLLHECENWERSLRKEEVAELAAQGFSELVLAGVSAPGATEARAERTYRRLSDLVRTLGVIERRGGDTAQAEALDKLIGSGVANWQASALRDRLEQMSRDSQAWYGDFDHQTADQLKASADELGRRVRDSEQIAVTVVDCDEARLSLAVEGEHRRGQQPEGLAAAFMLLSFDIGVVVDGPQPPTVAQVTAFAERAAALANMRGDQERNAAIAAAAKHQQEADRASALDALAAEARHAADHADERLATRDAIAKAAAGEKAQERAEQAQDRAAAAEQLRELVARDAALKAEELAARQAFADAERHLAEAMPALADQAKAAEARTPDKDTTSALEQAREELPHAEQQALALEKAAEQRPASLQAITPQAADAGVAQTSPDAPQQPTAPASTQPPSPQQADQAQQDQSPQQAAQAQQAQSPQQAAQAPQQEPHPQQAAQAQQAQSPQQAAQTPQQAAQAPQSQPPPTGIPSAALVQQANALADELAAQAATPVADRYQHHPAPKAGRDDPARQPAAEVGQNLADLVAEQRDAANRLAQVINAEDQQRTQLAQAVEADAGLAAPSPADADPATQSALAQPAASPASAPAQAAQPSPQTQAALQAQHTANDLQQQADRAQTSAERAQQAAEQATQDAQLGGDHQRAEQSAAQAAAAEQQAVAAETKALDAQLGALSQLRDAAQQSGDPQAEAAAAEAAANLTAAEQDSFQAAGNARQDGQQDTAAQATANLDRAATALQSLAGSLPRDAQALAQQLSAEAQAATPPSAAAAPAAPAAATADAQAAAQALSEIQAAPGQGSGFQQAAATLAAAAQQARMAHALGQGQGHSSQPGGENHGTASSTGEAGSALGMRTAPAGIDQADWARSRAEVKQNVRTGGVEQFSEEHQEAIRAYLKRLGEGQ